MPIELANIRNELLPGLQQITWSYQALPLQWSNIFEQTLPELPALGMKVTVALAAGAVIAKNPEVSRRGLFGWWGK